MNDILIVFVKNPIKGSVKSRLAKTIGNVKALSVYNRLLYRTKIIILNLIVDKRICYSDFICKTDLWELSSFQKSLQFGDNLGLRMYNAIKEASDEGYSKICLIGSDSMELTSDIVNSAFNLLDSHDVVLGPSSDGGYYLIGMKPPIKNIFDRIDWSTELVLKQTIKKAENLKLGYRLLPVLNDIDEIDDINDADRDYLLS